MAETTLLTAEVILVGKFAATVKVLQPPAAPVKVDARSVTLGVPILGSVRVAYIG
jgi:hypothetical protein